MGFDDYAKALKSGKREYQRHLSEGAYPYLQALEETISHVDIVSEVKLGLAQIPAELIAGTRSAGRRTAFAPNFMPLLDPHSEFAGKWIRLCDSHLEEGIRDPVIACEFMGRFYIVEGNKRVSVLKYFDSPTIPAYVTRLVPRRTEETENLIYYEYMDFHRISGVNYVLFSRKGSYPALAAAVAAHYSETGGEEAGCASAPWSDEMRMDFPAAYVKFRSAYLARGGSRLPIRIGDALLTYIGIYGYSSLLTDPAAQVKENIAKIWGEFVLLKEGQAVELVMDPLPDSPKKKLFDIFLPNSQKLTKIAFIHSKSASTSSWTYAHELGRRHAEEVLQGRIETMCLENVTPGEDALRAVQRAVEAGCGIIFTTTPEFIPASLKAAVEAPGVKILNCSLNTSHRYIRTYYGRMYEAKFLCGMIAGVLADNNRIGYIADYPIYGMTANINAFALGAAMTNPRAEIYLKWSTMKNDDVAEDFRRKKISYVSSQDMIVPRCACRQFGLFRFGNVIGQEEEPYYAATPLWNWGRFYEKIIGSILGGSWNIGDASDAKALNYWWGLSAGVVDLVYTQNLAPGTKRLVDFVRNGIESGAFHPFSGPLYSQGGTAQTEEGHVLSPEEIITMDWLAKNVIGEIPDFSDLTEAAQAVVRLQGIRKPEAAPII